MNSENFAALGVLAVSLVGLLVMIVAYSASCAYDAAIKRSLIRRAFKRSSAKFPDSAFSDFMRNATDEQKARVYGRVLEKSTEDQRKSL